MKNYIIITIVLYILSSLTLIIISSIMANYNNKEYIIDKYSRTGELWTIDENNKMLELIKNDKTIDEIATEHKRTKGTINARLKLLATQYWFNDNLSIDEIKNITKLSKEQIEYAINTFQNKKIPNKLSTGYSDSIKDIMNKKELELQETISYYKENMEQVIRIKLLEEELEILKLEAENKYTVKLNEIKQNKINEEIIAIMIIYCEKAYKQYIEQLSTKTSNKDTVIIHENINNTALLKYGMLGIGDTRLQYSFKKVNDTIYYIDCVYINKVKLSGSYTPSTNICLLSIQ